MAAHLTAQTPWTTEEPGEGLPRDDSGARIARVEARSDTAVSTAAGGVTSRLTARQLQVIALLVDGLRYRDVAECLSISPGQVQRHVSHAVTRAGVLSINALVALAVAEGLLPAGETSPPAGAASLAP